MHRKRLLKHYVFALITPLVLFACGGQGIDTTPQLSPQAKMGELAFNDVFLSASGKQSCASCHSATSGHNAPNDLSAQLGGTTGLIQGVRAAQTARYLANNPAFSLDDEGIASGGFFWDGRADSLAQQAGMPLLNPKEMANLSKEAVIGKVKQSAWGTQFSQLYGETIWGDTNLAFEKLSEAIAAFEHESKQFNAFTSKFDAVLRKSAAFTTQEQRGLMLFNDPKKGNCAACHTSSLGSKGEHPVFTDFSYDNLGVPRNPKLLANNDANYYDLGLCNRPELANQTQLCGKFKVPTLRNVALKQVFFHNGVLGSLKEVLNFYVTRDTQPERWYPLNADGSVNQYNDVPAEYKANVNKTEVPYNRKVGDAPALTPQEIDDVVAFLGTLTDGWKK